MPATIKRDFRVIIVEDDPVVRTCLSEYLKYLFRVDCAATAAEAIDRITVTSDVGAILLDLVLPNGQGIETLVRFQSRFENIPIIVVSGGGHDPQEVILAGAQDYLEKGHFTREELIQTIAKAVARHQVRKSYQPMGDKLVEFKESVAKDTLRALDTVGKPTGP